MTPTNNPGAVNQQKNGRAPEGTADNNHIVNDTPPSVFTKPKSQREIRCLQALINAPDGVYRHDLDDIVGTGNSPEYVGRLRMTGYDIITERMPMIDRDGRKIRVGRYRLSADHREAAIAVLGQ